MSLGRAIKKLRKSKGWTQDDFADKTGFSKNAICQIETDTSFPQKQTLLTFAQALGTTPGMLLLAAVDEKDIPAHKLKAFKIMYNGLLEYLNS